jgi:predicted DNA-binding transcriptional regulator YafY
MPPRPLTHRAPLSRIQHIFKRLKDGDYPNCKSLAKELEVAERTIKRDIDFMRDQQGLPIEYDPTEYGYWLTQEVHNLPATEVTEGEMLALLVAQKTMEAYRDTPIHAQLDSAFRKLLLPLQDFIRYTPAATEISLKVPAPSRHEPTLYKTLTEAMVAQQELSFDYKKPQDAEFSRRKVCPYHLTCRDSRWYLIALDLDHKALRTFALSRMRNARIGAKSFERPKDFSVENYFKHTLGVVIGEGTAHYDIRIHFDAFATPYIKEQFIHDSQEFVPLADGTVELRLVLSDFLEAERLVLLWAGHAEALEPPAFREKVASSVRDLAARHLTGAPTAQT